MRVINFRLLKVPTHECYMTIHVTLARPCVFENDYTKQRIPFHHHRGLRPSQIKLQETEIVVSRQGVAKFIERYNLSETIARRSESGGQSKGTERCEEACGIIDATRR